MGRRTRRSPRVFCGQRFFTLQPDGGASCTTHSPPKPGVHLFRHTVGGTSAHYAVRGTIGSPGRRGFRGRPSPPTRRGCGGTIGSPGMRGFRGRSSPPTRRGFRGRSSPPTYTHIRASYSSETRGGARLAELVARRRSSKPTSPERGMCGVQILARPAAPHHPSIHPFITKPV